MSSAFPMLKLILRRRLTASSRAWINDLPVSIAALRRLESAMCGCSMSICAWPMWIARWPCSTVTVVTRSWPKDAAARTACLALEVELSRLAEGEQDGLKELDYLVFLRDEIVALDPRKGSWRGSRSVRLCWPAPRSERGCRREPGGAQDDAGRVSFLRESNVGCAMRRRKTCAGRRSSAWRASRCARRRCCARRPLMASPAIPVSWLV